MKTIKKIGRSRRKIYLQLIQFMKGGSLEVCVAASTLSCLLLLQAFANINPQSTLFLYFPSALQRGVRAVSTIDFAGAQVFAVALLLLSRYVKNLYMNISISLAIFGAFTLNILLNSPVFSHDFGSKLWMEGLSLSNRPFKDSTITLILVFLAVAGALYLFTCIIGWIARKTYSLAKKAIAGEKNVSTFTTAFNARWTSKFFQVLIFTAAISQVVYLSVIYQNRQDLRRASIPTIESTPVSSKPTTWSYRDQGKWHEQYRQCNPTLPQSPIDISYEKKANNKSVFFPEGITKFEVIDAEPLGIEVRPMNGMFLTIADQIHKLESIKLKSPSEHKRDGVSFPLELQLYLRDSESRFAAISQVYTIGEANATLQNIIAGIVSTNTLDKKVGLDLANLLSVYPGRNATYNGSLPFPPCDSTAWIHFEEVKNLSWTQFKYFSQVLGTKRRNLQILPPDIAHN